MENINVSIIGSGNWGSTVGRLIARNVKSKIKMWVFEEMVNGKKLTEIINTEHENVKYLPGVKLPENIVADPDVVNVAKDTDLFIFVIPHKFLINVIKQIKGKIKPNAGAISLIKGFEVITVPNKKEKEILIMNETIENELGISCLTMMGANVANEVAKDQFCESTIAYKKCEKSEETEKNLKFANTFKSIFDQPLFRINIIPDINGCQVCGAVKNCVALGVGFVDGLDMGFNSKSAIVRIGLMEMIKFAKTFFTNVQDSTFFESCGVADLITTCFGGRNCRCASAFVKNPEKSWKDIEKEILNGMQLEGLGAIREVAEFLQSRDKFDEFPLLKKIYLIAEKKEPAKCIIEWN